MTTITKDTTTRSINRARRAYRAWSRDRANPVLARAKAVAFDVLCDQAPGSVEGLAALVRFMAQVQADGVVDGSDELQPFLADPAAAFVFIQSINESLQRIVKRERAARRPRKPMPAPAPIVGPPTGLASMFRDPFVAAAFRRAEGDSDASPVICASVPKLSGGASARVMEAV